MIGSIEFIQPSKEFMNHKIKNSDYTECNSLESHGNDSICARSEDRMIN